MEIKTILNLMATYQLTADELLLIYLTFLARDEEGHPEYFAQWFNNGGQDRLKDLFNLRQVKTFIAFVVYSVKIWIVYPLKFLVL